MEKVLYFPAEQINGRENKNIKKEEREREISTTCNTLIIQMCGVLWLGKRKKKQDSRFFFLLFHFFSGGILPPGFSNSHEQTMVI